MKLKQKVLILSIEILFVTLALAMTIFTYAWYTSNTLVQTAQTSVTAAAGAGTEIVLETNPEFDAYMGQKGTDSEDEAAYYVTKEMTVTFTPISTESAVQLNFVSIDIATINNGTVSSSSDDNVIPSFTWRLTYNGHEYRPDENGFAYYMSGEDRVYIEISTTTTISVVFKLIYLDDASYAFYQAGTYGSVTPFRYSGWEYMRATFTVLFEIGIDKLVVAE